MSETRIMQVEGEPIFTRLIGEPEKAWEVFEYYRDMEPPRSKKEAASMLGCSTALLSLYGKEFDWDTRIATYDRYRDREKRQAYAEVQREDVAAQRAMAKSMWMLVLKELVKWHKLVDGNRDGPTLSIKELAMLAEVGTKVTRALNQDEELRDGLDSQLAQQMMRIGDAEIFFS